ncbi:MAG: TonB-dependent receptor [Pseudomonadales bacterium]
MNDPVRFLLRSLFRVALVNVVGASVFFAALPARSTELIEEIVVTGEFRRATLVDTAASVSVVPLEDYRSGTVNHLEEILGRLPNVNLASGSSRARFVQIRGIGERGQFTEPLNPSVALVQDGVDLSGLGSTATLFDVAQVEVLRGPQGTLYGANALAGLINIRSADPTDEFAARLQLDGGDYGAVGVGAVVSGPINPSSGFRLAARQYRDDGFLDNDHLRASDTNERDERTVRSKLTYAPNETTTWTTVLGYVDVDNGYDAFSLDNNRSTLSDEPGRDRQRSTYASLGVRLAESPLVAFEGVLGLVSGRTDYGYDEDWTFSGFHPDGYASTDRYLRDREVASLDLRWLSAPEGRLFGVTDWVVGFYGLTQEDTLDRRYTFADPFDSEFSIDRTAAYAEVDHPLGDTVRARVGARVEQHASRYRDSEGVAYDPDDRLLGGRAVLEWDYRPGAMAYISTSRGYKAGGFNISGTLDADLRGYDPEALWNHEIGVKGRWLDDRLTARAAVFLMHRDDVQVETSIVRVRPDGSAEFIDLISNAAEGVNQGLELEAEWQVAATWSAFAALGLLDTAFDDFTNQNGEDLDGEPQAHAPRWQGLAGLEWRPMAGWYARVEAEGKDSFYYSNSERLVPRRDDVRSDAYVLWHATVGFEGERFAVKFWARNLGDEEYATRGYYFGNDPRDGYAPHGYVQLGEPRRVGVTVTLWN